MVGEDEQRLVCFGHEQEVGELLVVLRAGRERRFLVERGIHALQLPRPRERHDDFLRRGGLFLNFQRGFVRQLDGCAALVGEFLGNLLQFLADDRQQLLLAVQDALQAVDELQDVLVLLAQGDDFQIRQPLQAHVQDCLRLRVGQLEALHQAGFRFLRVLRGANQRDDLVEVVHRNHQTLQNVRAGFRLLQVVLRAAGDDVLLMADEVPQHRLQPHQHGFALGDGNHVHAEGDLQVRIFVEHFQHLVRVCVLFQLDNGAHSLAVGFVANVVDVLQLPLLFFRQLQNLLQHRGLVDHVGDFRDDKQLAPVHAVLHMHARAQGKLRAPGLIASADFLVFHQHAAGGEVRAGDDFHQFIQRNVRILHHSNCRADAFAQIVRGDVRRKPYRDAACAVDEQIREARGQHVRLFERVVEIQAERHGVLLDVAQHFQRKGRHARLGITHGGGAVAVNRAEVAVPIDHRTAHGEVLRHAHERVVHGGIAVRVIFAQAVADDAGALAVRLIRRRAQFHHGIENAALHGL